MSDEPHMRIGVPRASGLVWPRASGLVWRVLLTASALLPLRMAAAATPLQSLRVSSDITVQLGGATLDDESVGSDNLIGTVTPVNIGSIPSQADLDAYHRASNGDQLLSFDTTIALPGGVTARPGDVVRFNGASYSIAFNAAASGVPDGANVDAVALLGTSLLLSFDVTVNLGGVVADDEDIVLFDALGFSMFFDGSAAGISTGLDLDAADYLECNGHLLLSFDGSGTVGGVAFDDEDLLEHDRVATWEMVYDGSARYSAWAAADLDAVHATVNPGPGPAAVFGQTIRINANKVIVQWPNPVGFRAVRGSFASQADIGVYTVGMSWSGTGATLMDASMPATGHGFWYFVKPGGCSLSSWQSTLGAEPGRDAAIP